MNFQFITKRFNGDRVIWCILFTLCFISIIEVYSASSPRTYNADFWAPALLHGKFVIGGVIVAWLTHTLKYEWIKDSSKNVYIVGILLLLYALFGGGANINSSMRWVNIFGIKLQHFEIVKLGTVMITALILAKAQTEERAHLSWNAALSLISNKLKGDNRSGDYTMLSILVCILIPCAFIITANLSTVAIILAASILMMIVGRVNWKHLVGLIGAGIAIIALGIATLLVIPDSFKEYGTIGSKVITWKNRILDSKDSFGAKDADDVVISGNEQMIYSKVAIAEGGVTGRGPGNSVRRDFIPHAYNDYIFAILVEELGLLGGVFTIILYLTLLYRCGIIAKNCDDPYAIFLVTGIGILICIQAMLHMTISVSNIVTGQPLPLISQGGTSFIINCIYIGIIQSISKHTRRQNKGTGTETAENPETQTN